MLRVFLVVAAVHIPVALESAAASHPGVRLVVTLADLALVLLLIPVTSRVARGCPATSRRLLDEAARVVSRGLRGFVVGFVCLQFVLVAAFTFLGPSKEAWFFIYPVLLVFFRFALAEMPPRTCRGSSTNQHYLTLDPDNVLILDPYNASG